MNNSIKFHYYDANCLVKLVINEQGSNQLKDHFYHTGSVAITTDFYFYEALGVLKTKWVQKKRPDTIDKETYLAACEELCALVDNEQIQIESVAFYKSKFFNESEKLTKKLS